MDEWIIASVGGSMVVPSIGISTDFLNNLRDLVARITKTRRIVIIIGGGKTCREYQNAARSVGVTSTESLDWIGIMSTRLNAELVRQVLGIAHPVLIDPENGDVAPDARVIIGAGGIPGWSTDYDAFLFAKRLRAVRIINVSNVAYVYGADPKLVPDAKRYTDITWEEMRAIIGDAWTPGMNVPFDPVAARMCQEYDISVAMVSGDDLQNVEHALLDKPFDGTKIHP